MHVIRIHKVINRLISILRLIGIWSYGDKPVKERIIKWVYCSYYILFVVALTLGAISSKTKDEAIFTAEIAIKVAVLTVKFFVLIWKQKKIQIMINRIGVLSIRHEESFTFCNEKLERFMKLAVVFLISLFICSVFAGVVIPFLGSERNLIFEIAFPWDFKNNDVAFLVAIVFVATETFLTNLPIIFSVIIWYLMFSCFLRYKVLAADLRNMGRIVEQETASKSDKEMHKIFLRDLEMSIVSHKHLRGLIDEFGSFSANLFFLQFCISGICICTSTYCMAINMSENLVERFVYMYSFIYNISELFMITYLGNDIKLSSNRLSYSLFESPWIDQPLSTNKCVIIFGEFLKQPHVLLIGKLYPLTLETFNKILNSAYSMFNILNE
uniref:Odorant receptor n=1 Tax=Bradysia odoriphaga TaxID=1564500 RepID=A0A6B9C904_9DIPT|nr:odorant receptor 37 [Bradysia odoriphaga]